MLKSYQGSNSRGAEAQRLSGGLVRRMAWCSRAWLDGWAGETIHLTSNQLLFFQLGNHCIYWFFILLTFSFSIKLLNLTFLLDLAYTGVTPDSSVAETNIIATEELANKTESEKSCLSLKERDQVTATPHITKAEEDNHPGIKLQIAPIPRWANSKVSFVFMGFIQDLFSVSLPQIQSTSSLWTPLRHVRTRWSNPSLALKKGAEGEGRVGTTDRKTCALSVHTHRRPHSTPRRPDPPWGRWCWSLETG